MAGSNDSAIGQGILGNPEWPFKVNICPAHHSVPRDRLGISPVKIEAQK